METKIKFQDLVNKCSEFLNGVITQEELAEATKDMRVRYYIPMKEKIEIIQDIFYESYYIMEPLELRVMGIEISKFLKGFMAYFSNIEYTEEDKELLNHCDESTYEALNQVLFIGSPDLTVLFEKDYKCLCEIINNISLQADINGVLNVLEGLDTEALKEENKKLRRSFKDITKSKEGQRAVADLLEIARFNDPTMKKIIENEALSNSIDKE